MQLSNTLIKKFQVAVNDDYGYLLSEEQAEAELLSLVELTEIIGTYKALVEGKSE